MNIETGNEASSDLPPEFVDTARNFYGSAAECMRKFRDLRDITNVHGMNDVAQLYADAHADLTNAYHLVLKFAAPIREGGNTLQIATLDHAMEDIDSAVRIINLNNEMIKVKFEGYKRRRIAGGYVNKVVGLLSNVRGIGSNAIGTGINWAGKGKRMADRGIVKVVRAVVPKPLRKAVSWVGQIGQDVQDFWSEVF